MTIDETSIQVEKQWWYKRLAERTVQHFKKRNINAQYVATREEASSAIMALIPNNATIGWGDSVTLEQIGVVEKIRRTMQNRLFDPFVRDANGELLVTGDTRLEEMKKAMMADVFMSGVNAITQDGKIVNIDGVGNRVAPTIFGPKKVILAAGVNKIVKNIDEALKRVREISAPINGKRHVDKHNSKNLADLPCVKTGVCVDCFSSDRMCRYTVIIEGEKSPATVTDYLPRIHVIIVGEELGI